MPGAWLRTLSIVSPASSVAPTCSGDSAASCFFCCRRRRRIDAVGDRAAEFAGELGVELAGIAAGVRRDLGRQQRRGDAVLVGGPDRAVAAQEGGAGAFFAAEAQRAVEQAVDEPLEADRHLVELAAEPRRHAVDQLRADHGLADGGAAPHCGRCRNR